ncbi:MAG: hypothetical protein JSS20_02565 [Proteobacteria bacterium]|nr:hypothetical protein [Pseudomonadota bacterium]
MASTDAKLMTPEEFFVWQQRQDDRYELVEGVPVILRDPLTMMTGAKHGFHLIGPVVLDMRNGHNATV